VVVAVLHPLRRRKDNPVIRKESFALSPESFAAERKKILADADARLRPHVAEALGRVGLPSWELQIVDAALDVFDETARAEVDAWNQVLDDMRDMFAKELGDSLAKTTRAQNRDAQADTITRWVSTMAHNAAMEAATTSDTNANVGLEWVTMGDSEVRSPHKEANGQTVPTGQEFEVGGEKMLYPGQPVGDPSNWINCRCVARPSMLDGDLSSNTLTASAAPGLTKDGSPPKCKYCEAPATQYVLHSEGMAFVPACDEHIDQAKADAAATMPDGEPDPGNIDKVGTYSLAATPEAGGDVSRENEDEDGGYTTCVIVALPAADDPISAASSEADGAHATLLFLGDAAALDEEQLKAAVSGFVTEGEVGIITEQVNGRAVLGKDAADVVLFDAANLVFIRDGLIQNSPYLSDAYNSVEQFPTWLPHVTLGYPETPVAGEYSGEAITFDRLAVWFGESRTEYPLGGSIVPAEEPKKEIIHPEDGGFTQEIVDAIFANTPEGDLPVAKKEPAEAAPAAEAPAAPAPGGSDLRPWHGVLAPEAAPSGDKRQFAERALTTRDLPLPLKAMFTDDEGHKGSVVVGRIDEVFRDGGLIKAKGVWDNSPEAEKAAGMIDRKMWRGVSVDLDAAEGEVVQATEEGGHESIEFSKGRISSATLCAIPAFAEAFVRNGTWEDFANEPMPTGAMVEIPDWPGAEVAPALSLVASAAPAISADYFRNPMLTEPTAVTRGEDGLIFGHLGVWDACHVAYEVCTTVPPSQTDYAYFLTGQVFTDAGPVAVGQLTVGGGHADMKLGVRAAIAHYDNVSSAVADITVGEDEFGVWFSGRIRPWATEKQIHELFAAGPSGDWRGVRYRGKDSMELIAAHAVNVPGFPVPRVRFAVEGTRQVSLVAAGIVARDADVQHAALERVNNLKASIRASRFADMKKHLETTMKGK
jgi:hypothetical protein